MKEPRNWVLRVRRFGNPDCLDVVEAPLPNGGPGRGAGPRGQSRSTLLAGRQMILEI
jgi:hypothetical protein